MVLKGPRIQLVPCSAEAARLITQGNTDSLRRVLGARIPREWPAADTKNIAPFYLKALEADPEMLGWGLWIAIHQKENVVVGDAGFKGKPDVSGIVEIGYGIVEPYRNNGYATEAASLLIGWAFSRVGVTRVVAECRLDNAPSSRVLEKLHMRRTVVEGGLQKWELLLTQWARERGD